MRNHRINFLLGVLLVVLFRSNSFGQEMETHSYTDTLIFQEIIADLLLTEKGLKPNKFHDFSFKDSYLHTEDDANGNIRSTNIDSIARSLDLLDDSSNLNLSNRNLFFTNCFIKPTCRFRKLTFNHLQFTNCKSTLSSIKGPDNRPTLMDGRIEITDCIINDLYIHNWNSDNQIDIIELNGNNFLNLSIKGNSVENITIKNCSIFKFCHIGNNNISEALLLLNNNFGDKPKALFDEKTKSYNALDFTISKTLFELACPDNHELNCIIDNNFFNAYPSQDFDYDDYGNKLDTFPSEVHLAKFSGKFKNLEISKNDFNSNVEFYNSDVSMDLNINNNKFNRNVSLRGLLMSEKRNSINWHQFVNYKLFDIHREVESIGSVIGTTYNVTTNNGLSKKALKDSLGFFSLLATYKKLYGVYKQNNETEYANGCYAEMKMVETRRWKYLYQQNKSFESLFRWQLNVFLNYFTDYGTNPAKAVIKSAWVILLFALFYLFFPSDWDVSNRSQLLATIKDLTSKNRERTFLWTLGFVGYSGLIHVLNALTLSLNAFTTLGFGDIPTHGAARYVTIVQGFIGWFLLTIFSVSLINQVLG